MIPDVEMIDAKAPGPETKEGLIALYMDEYPEEHVDGLVALYAHKADNPEATRLVGEMSRPYTRSNLFQVMSVCTAGEISYVGW